MRSIDYVNLTISKQLGIPLNVVESVNKEYWREIKRKMNTCESTNIYVKKIGTFSVSKYLINKKIGKTIGYIRSVGRNEKFSEEKKIEIINSVKQDLRKLLYQRNELAKIKYERPLRVPKTDPKGNN